MHERVPPEKDTDDEETPAAPDTFVVEKPLVQSQDLEHQPRPETRVSNTGVKVKPPVLDDPEGRDAEEDQEKEQEKAQDVKPGRTPG